MSDNTAAIDSSLQFVRSDQFDNKISWRDIDPIKFCSIKAALSSIEETIGYPFALIKTHQQVSPHSRRNIFCRNLHDTKTKTASSIGSQSSFHHRTLSSFSKTQLSTVSPHNTFSYLRHICKNLGIKGIYRGYVWYIIPAVPVNVLYYYSYNEIKARLLAQDTIKSDRPKVVTQFAISAIGGVLADALCLTCWVPFEILTQHLQLQDVRKFPYQAPSTTRIVMNEHHFDSSNNNNKLTALKVCRHLWNTQGLRGFYRGYLVSLAIHTPSSGVWWASYEFTKQTLSNSRIFHQKKKNSEIPIIILSGCVAGASASICSNPLNVVKTRLQTTLGPNFEPSCSTSANHHHLNPKPNFSYHMKLLLGQDGVSGLLRGFVPRMFVSIPTSALSLLVYEFAFNYSSRDTK